MKILDTNGLTFSDFNSTEVENTYHHFGHFGPTLTSFLRVKEWKYQKILKDVRWR